MTWQNRVLAGIVVVAGFWAIYHFCWLPYTCNLAVARIELVTTRLLGEIDANPGAAALARKSLHELNQRARDCPDNMNVHALAGINHRILRQYEQAASSYVRALQFDRRPELYLNLGFVEVERGNLRGAVEQFTQAVRLDPSLIDQVQPFDVRTAVSARTIGIQPDASSLLKNGDFRFVGSRGRRTRFEGAGDGGPSAADDWRLYNPAEGLVETELQPSGEDGDSVLRVASRGRRTGIRQVLPVWDHVALASLRIRIRVRQGRALIGAGNEGGRNGINPGATAEPTSQWQIVEVRSANCPVRIVNILCDADECDFQVDRAELIPIPATCDAVTTKAIHENSRR